MDDGVAHRFGVTAVMVQRPIFNHNICDHSGNPFQSIFHGEMHSRIGRK